MIIKKENIACILLNPEKKCLLVKRAPKDDSLPGFWELPSGGIDKGEKMEKTLVREVLEESGIDITPYSFKKVDEEQYTFKRENGDIKDVTETTFLVLLNNTPEVILSDEHVDFQWVNLEELENVFSDKEDLIYKRMNRVLKE
jgi:8-oxo-dGTP diphosphatase